MLLFSQSVEAGIDGCEPGCDYPNIYNVCWSVTNYWPFALVSNDGLNRKIDFYKLPPEKVESILMAVDANWIPVKWNGQADDTPTITGDGFKINPYSDDRVLVAGPIPTYGMTFRFPWGEEIVQHDTFGNEVYQRGIFWHHGYERYVIGVEILSWHPIHYLECQGVILP